MVSKGVSLLEIILIYKILQFKGIKMSFPLMQDKNCTHCQTLVKAGSHSCPNCEAEHSLIIKEISIRLLFNTLMYLGVIMAIMGLIFTFMKSFSYLTMFFGGIGVFCISIYIYYNSIKVSFWRKLK